MTAEWTTRAACRAADPDLFDTCCAAKTVPHDAATWCNACPVRQQCLDMAMRIEAGTAATYRFGIFGGLAPQQRADLFPTWAQQQGVSPHATRSGLAPCGTAAAYRRHKRNNEPIDQACETAHLQMGRERRAAQASKAAHARTTGTRWPDCGTPAALQRHREQRVQLCPACRPLADATRKPSPGSKRKPIAHGTYQGSQQHRYRKEPLCEPCRQAYNTWQQERRERDRDRRAREREARATRVKAVAA